MQRKVGEAGQENAQGLADEWKNEAKGIRKNTKRNELVEGIRICAGS